MDPIPILYSFRRCPYAIRARMALAYAGLSVEVREVVLRDKPVEMLHASAKGTVPVLVLGDGTVLDESMLVMDWALAQADPDHWLSEPVTGRREDWIDSNDGDFKHWLDLYKYADRHPEHPAEWYRSHADAHLRALDDVLAQHPWLHGTGPGIVDVALFPFIRQFAMVDYAWFSASSYNHLRRWLERWLEDDLFQAIMPKLPRWEPGQEPVYLRAPGLS